MVGPATYSTHIPADVALTEHSRKFYDGTYKWDSEGFTDESGRYHEFDCYDPAARAPTPLPPMCLSDEEANEGDVISEESAVHTLGSSTSSPLSASNVKHSDVALAMQERIIGNMENGNPATPSKTITTALQDFSSPSELSECPSDLSEWDVGKSMSGPKTIKNKPVDEMFEQDDAHGLQRKPTTRGVAQKVKKGAKKSTTRSVKSSVTTETVQTGSYMSGSGATMRRRSTRLSQGGQ
ncbi:hypothetical protein ACET3X_000285 [Alternaria dauci]|uniref:Uncharacterized protein n=1 Tax=Alternaria dauci TaxID=48095 RepID=A0ABR3UU41_9PLEO